MKYYNLEELAKIQVNMEKYGGGFVKALSWAMVKADSNNLARISMAFPEIMNEYLEMT